jgi:hypothetical protein
MTKQGCEWIDFEMKNYNLSMQACMKDDSKAKTMREIDEEVRNSLEPMEFTVEKAKIISICKAKLVKDLEMSKKI